MQKCKLCAHEQNDVNIYTKDFMYHNSGDFLYKKCEECGCLWLDIIPDNLAEYYNNTSVAGGDGYNSFKMIQRSKIKSFFRRARNKYGILNQSIIGKIIYSSMPLPLSHTQIGKLGLSLNSQILDIGCGSGALIRDLQQIGFRNVMGIDAFIDNNQEDIIIEKYDIIEYDEKKDESYKFDLIMMHHSFEHIGNSLETLISINRRLKHNGKLLLVLPVAGAGLDTYKEYWYAINAPYHFYLHSLKSLQTLADKSRFEFQSISYDDSYLWYCKSELYKRNVLFSEIGFRANDYFSKDEIDNMKNLSRMANLKNNGDCAVIVLKKKK